ncbi:MAG: PorT family protein [Muribaculaceae bacterium]|nr:PorT family protein [Muribaculaceae bacterium]
MRRIVLFLTALIVIVSAKAQTHYIPHVWIGGHAGMTMSEMSFSPSVRQSMTQGTTAGVAFRYAEERHVGLIAELNISQRGWKEDFEDAPFSYSRQLTYIELPILTHIFFGSPKFKGFVNLGPVVGYMIGDNISSDFNYANPDMVPGFPLENRSTEQMAMEVKNKFDYGITAGAGCEFVVKRRHAFTLEARYYFGLGNIYPSSKKDTFSASRGTSIMVTLGYMFRLK